MVDFFLLEDFTEKKLKSTFQAMDDLESSTMGGGIPAESILKKEIKKSNDVALGK